MSDKHRCDDCGGDGYINGAGYTFGDNKTYYRKECPSCDNTGYKSDKLVKLEEILKVEEIKGENIILKSKMDRIRKIIEE